MGSGGGAPRALGRSVGCEGELVSLSPYTASGKAGAGGRDTEVALPRRPPTSCVLLCLFLMHREVPPHTAVLRALRVQGETVSRDPAQAGASLAVLLGEVTVSPSLQVI